MRTRFAVLGLALVGGVAGAADPPGPLVLRDEHHSAVCGVGFPKDGHEVLTTDHSGATVRWGRATGKPLGKVLVHETGPGSEFYSMTLSPDAARGIGLKTNHLYDPATGDRKTTFPRHWRDDDRGRPEPVPSADLSRLAVVYMPDEATPGVYPCDIWDVLGRRKLAAMRFEARRGALAVGFSCDTARLVVAALVPPPAGEPRNDRWLSVSGWDVGTGKKLGEAVAPVSGRGYRLQVAVAGEKSAVVLVGGGRAVVADYGAGRFGDEIDIGPGEPHGTPPVFDAAGGRFALPVRDGADQYGVRVYDWPRGRQIGEYLGHVAPVQLVVFAADGKTLATSAGTTVSLWDLTGPAPKK